MTAVPLWLFPFGEETFLWDQILWTGEQGVTRFKQAEVVIHNAIVFIQNIPVISRGRSRTSENRCSSTLRWGQRPSREKPPRRLKVVPGTGVHLYFGPVLSIILEKMINWFTHSFPQCISFPVLQQKSTSRQKINSLFPPHQSSKL